MFLVVCAKRCARPWEHGGGENRHGACPYRASSLMYSVTLYSCDCRLRSVLCMRRAGAVRWENASGKPRFLQEVRLH